MIIPDLDTHFQVITYRQKVSDPCGSEYGFAKLAENQEEVERSVATCRNTDYVFGCVVYTGKDTKMSQNSKSTANKFSTVEVTMNKARGRPKYLSTA